MSPAHVPSPADRETGLSFAQSERRQHRRYPITAQSEYILAGNRAQATTVNISSGVFLKTDQLLPVGKRIQVFINWPVLLDQRGSLQLVLTGRVLRSDEAGAAAKNLRYDFKIRQSEQRGSRPRFGCHAKTEFPAHYYVAG
jgi:hypothetical protein